MMDSDEELARRLQAEFDEEERNTNAQEKQDEVFAQKLASQSHDLSDSDDDVAVIDEDRNSQVESSNSKTDKRNDLIDTVSDSEQDSRSSPSEDNRKNKGNSPNQTLSSKQSPPSKQTRFSKESTSAKQAPLSKDSPQLKQTQSSKKSSPSTQTPFSKGSVSVKETPSCKDSPQLKQTPSSSQKKRPLCKFGSDCYRKNPWHLEEFYHPHLEGSEPSKVESTSSPGNHKDCLSFGSHKNSSSSGSDEPPLKRQKSNVNESSSQGANMSKKPFSTRLLASAPFNLFLNKTFSVKGTHDDPLNLVFPDILNPKMGEIVESAQLNFMVDLQFLMDNYKACQVDKKPLLVMYGQMEGNPKNYEQVTCTKVNLPFQYGTHHTKMMLIQYTNGLRVVIHTANLVPDDWEEKTQGYWVSPLFPELENDKSSLVDGESPTRFKRDLVEYLLSYKAPDLTRWSHILRKYDFTSCNMIFIGSTPGYHTGEHKDKWGHMKVRRVMRQHAAPWKSSLPILAQCSSIGSLGKDAKSWLSGELGMSLTGAPGVCANPPSMKVVYPSEENIRTSSQGWMGGSCLPYNSETHAKQQWLEQHLYLWKSEKRRRSRAMPHIKTYTRLNKENTKAQFFLLSSANLSKAAWGMLQKQNSQLFIRSYEVGILAIPKFLTGKEDFELKSPWKELGFSLPYDVPLSPYPAGAKPWFMNTKKKEKDVLGILYPL